MEVCLLIPSQVPAWQRLLVGGLEGQGPEPWPGSQQVIN
jgi:hypothetical protein